MADEYVRTHQQAYNNLETEAKGLNAKTQKKALIEIRYKQLQKVVSLMKHCDKKAISSGETKYATAFNHWTKQEVMVNKKLWDLGERDDDNVGPSGGDNDDLPPPDRVKKNGKWVDIKK